MTIAPGMDAAAAVAAAPAGTAFVFAPGVHRIAAPIVPKDGDSFTGRPGAVLSGAAPLSGFMREGGVWVLARAFEKPDPHGECSKALDGSERTACRYPEELFLDGEPLARAEDADGVNPQTWYLDYEGARVLIGGDPTSRSVEMSLAAAAFMGAAKGVRIKGLTVEMFASKAQRGAIDGIESDDWVVEANEVRLNHGHGIRVGPRMTVRRNFVHRNGQLGVGGAGNDILIESNLIAGNNRAGFNREWEAGGAKFVIAHNLTVRHNCFLDNDGYGLWTDIWVDDLRVEGNRVIGNAWSGIAHEIGYRAVIRGNFVAFNGARRHNWLWGAQILIQNSRDTLVEGNTVVVGADGGDGIGLIYQRRSDGLGAPARTLRNTVLGNVIVDLSRSGQTGGVFDFDGTTFIDGANRFDGNRYYFADPLRAAWAWGTRGLDWAEFRGAGQESNGMLSDDVASALGALDDTMARDCGLPPSAAPE
ncbi:MAG: right-handed parallel beta-helix repeat-containing protein [Alphaproteobacteria bacterium]